VDLKDVKKTVCWVVSLLVYLQPITVLVIWSCFVGSTDIAEASQEFEEESGHSDLFEKVV